MFPRGFRKNRRFFGGHNFMRNQQMGLPPMPMGPMPMPMGPLPPFPEPIPIPVGPPVDPRFLRHTQTLPSISWCENELGRVKGSRSSNVPVMAISKKLSKNRRKSKEERMAKEARKLRKQERKLKLESIFMKSPTPERIPKPSSSKEKSEPPEKILPEKGAEEKTGIEKEINESEECADTKTENKSEDRPKKRTKKSHKNSSDLKFIETIEEIKLEKSPPIEIKYENIPDIMSEKPTMEKRDSPEKETTENKARNDSELKSDKMPENVSDKHKKAGKILDKCSSKIVNVKEEEHSEMEWQPDKRTEKRSQNKEKAVEMKPESSEKTLKVEFSEKKIVEKLPEKRVEKSSDKKPNKSLEKKLDKSLEKKVDKSSEKKLEKSSEKKIDETLEKIIEKSSEKNLVKHSERKLDKSVEKKRDKSIEKKLDKSSERKLDKSQEKKRDRSKEKARGRSNEKKRDKSTEKKHDKSSSQKRDKSQEKRRDKSSDKKRNTSPGKSRDKSTEKKRDKSIEKKRDKLTAKKREKVKEKKRNKMTDKKRDKSTNKKREKSPEKKRERSPDKKREKSPDKKREKSPDKKPEKSSDKKRVKSPEKKREKSPDKKREKSPDKKREKSPDKRREKSPDKTREKSLEKKIEKRSDKKSDKRSDSKSLDSKSDKRSKSRTKFESPEKHDSRSVTPVIFDTSEIPASPKFEMDETSEIYKQDEVEEPQTPPIIEALSKADGIDRKLSIFDQSPILDSPKLDESLLGAEMLKLNLENKLRELDAEEDDSEEDQIPELDIFSDSPKATEAMRTIWSIHPNKFNIPIKLTNSSLYDDDVVSKRAEPKPLVIKENISQIVKPVNVEPTTVHVINSLENLQVSYAEEDDEDVEMPLMTAALLNIPPGDWDDEYSNSSYTKLCDEIEKHKSMIQEKGQKESQKDAKKTAQKESEKDAQEDIQKEAEKETLNADIMIETEALFQCEVKQEPEDYYSEDEYIESEPADLVPKIEPDQETPKKTVLNEEYEAFIRLLDESDTSEKIPLCDRRSRSQSNSSNSSSRSSSSSSGSSGSSSSSSSSSTSSSSSDSSGSSSSSSSSASSSSSTSESSPQGEENDVLKRALEKIMEIIPENYDGGDRSGFNPEDLKNEILKILQSDANLNKKMQNVEIKSQPPKTSQLDQSVVLQSDLETNHSRIWNISTDSDEILMISPVKNLPKPKTPERTSHSSSSADRKSRKQSSDYHREKRSLSREKYHKQRSRDRSRDYYDDRRNSSRKRSKSPRRKSRSPVPKDRSRKSSLPRSESRLSPNCHKWTDNVSYHDDSSYISNYGFRPPSPKEPSHPEPGFQYPEISSSSWNSDPSIQYCAYPPANADTSPQRISLDERIDMALGISNNVAEHHPTPYYNYPSEGYPPHNEAYNTPVYNQYYHQYKEVPPVMPSYPVPPPSIHHNYYTPTYATHPPPPIVQPVVPHQSSPFLHRNISTPPIQHQPSPQSSQKASFAVQVGNVLEIIPSELPAQSVEVQKPKPEKAVNIVQSTTSPQPSSSSVSKTAEQIISDAVDQRKQVREQKRFTKKLRKEKLKLEMSKLITLSNSMKIAESLTGSIEAESDSNEVSTTVESTTSVSFELGKPERSILRQGEKTGVSTRKKVMFHDGIEPGNGTSATDDEIIPTEKIKKKKKRRYTNNKENIALINQLLETSRETSMNPEKPIEPNQPTEQEECEDNLPPPPPPAGSPPPNCLQPKLKNPPAPEYLYFHLNPNENRLILTPYRPQIFHMQNHLAQLQELVSQPNQRPSTPAAPVQTSSSSSLPFTIPSRLDGLLNDPRFAKAINALSNSLPLLRLPTATEPKNESKPSTPPISVGHGRDEAAKKTGSWPN